MKNENIKPGGSVHEWHGRPPITEVIPLALQHVVAMVVGCITPAIVVSGVVGLSAPETTLLVQSALLVAGFATLLQLFPFKNLTGAGLPVIMGVSFSYLPSLIAIGRDFGIATIFGAQICGAIAAIIFGLFVKRLKKFFPPLVSGTVVFTIGISLYPTAINYMAGGTSSPDYGSYKNWIVAIVTLVIVIFITHFTKGFLKLSALLVGVIFGYVISLALGMVSFDAVREASWFQLPQFFHFGIEFNPTAMVSIVILFIVNSVQAIGDMSATTAGSMDRMPSDKELQGGIIGNGISCIIGALGGGLPTATYSQNVGIVTVTRVINRMVITLAAVIILIAGFIPKLSAVLTTIPQCVLGGATITVFASITTTGIKLMTSEKMTARNCAVVGLAVALGVGITQVPDALGQFPSWVTTVFGTSSVVVTSVSAIILNIIIPKDKPDALSAKLDEETLKAE